MNWFKRGFPEDGEVPSRQEPSERAEEVASMCQEAMGTSGILDGEYSFLESIEKQALEKGWVTEKQAQAVEKIHRRVLDRQNGDDDRDYPALKYDGDY